MHNIMMELDGQTKLKVASYVYCAALMQMSPTSPVFSAHTSFQFILIGEGLDAICSVPYLTRMEHTETDSNQRPAV